MATSSTVLYHTADGETAAAVLRAVQRCASSLMGRVHILATAQFASDRRQLGSVGDLTLAHGHRLAWSEPAPSTPALAAVWCHSGSVTVCVSLQSDGIGSGAPEGALRDAAAVLAGIAARDAELRYLTELNADLRAAMAARGPIDQAIGVIMAESRCTSERAFAVLRAASQRSNEKVSLVARKIVEHVGGTPATEAAFVPPARSR